MAGNADQQTTLAHHTLISLVHQVARADRHAFACLYERLAPAVVKSLHVAVPDPVEATAITAATFVEVWLLARFHTAADTDVPAWILGIAIRRAGERWPAEARTGTGDSASAAPRPSLSPQAIQDRRNVLALAVILRHHVPAIRAHRLHFGAGHQPDVRKPGEATPHD